MAFLSSLLPIHFSPNPILNKDDMSPTSMSSIFLPTGQLLIELLLHPQEPVTTRCYLNKRQSLLVFLVRCRTWLLFLERSKHNWGILNDL